MNTISQKDILDKSKLALQQMFHGISVEEKVLHADEFTLTDGILSIENNDFNFIIASRLEVGKALNKLQKYKAARKLKHKPIILLDYATEEIADLLKEKNIDFIDAAGNSFINASGLKISVKGRDALKQPVEKRRSFQKEGLKLVFAFLTSPHILTESYRSISQKTGISLATISHVINELKEDKYLFEGHGGKYQLHFLKRLITKWAMSYVEVLRPQIHRGYFRMIEGKPEDIEFHKNDKLLLGGEFGACYFNHSLIPEKLTIYTSERLSSLISTYKFVPVGVNNGSNRDIELLTPFWIPTSGKSEKETNQTQLQQALTVDPILIYADLIHSTNYRNVETAENLLENEIRDRFIKDKLQW